MSEQQFRNTSPAFNQQPQYNPNYPPSAYANVN